MKNIRYSRSALRIALVYIFFAGLWILFSDRLVAALVPDLSRITFWQTVKGFFFIILMAVLLYLERAWTDRTNRRRAEVAEQNTLLFEQTPNPIWVVDPETSAFLEVNQSAVDLYGYTRKEFLALKTSDIRLEPLPEDTQTKLRALDAGQVLDYTARHKCKGGRVLEVKAIGRLTIWNGQPAMVAVIQDVTEFVRAQNSLSNLTTALRAMLNASPLAIYSLNAQGKITNWNPAAERIFGWSAAEVIGKPLPMISTDLEVSFEALHAALLTGVVVENFQTRCTRKDGQEIDLEISAAPLKASDGTLTGFLQIAADITARLKVQNELHAMREILSGLMENTPLPVYVINLNQEARMVNRAVEEILNLPREQILNRPVSELLKEPFLSQFIHSNRFVIETRSLLDTEEWITIHGEERCFHSIKYLLYDPNGDPIAVSGVYIEITEQKKTLSELMRLNAQLEKRVTERTQELAAKNAELETFTYSVSHDLKAPLRGIDGYTKLLMEDYFEKFDEEGRHFLANVNSSANQMSELIDDLLTYSRMERRNLNLMEINVQKLLERVLYTFTDEIKQRNAAVEIDLPFSIVHHDAESLAQVLTNLIDNALKFTSGIPQTRIEIGGREDAHHQVLWVKDNGVGFEKKYTERIFEIFQRLHRAEEYPGTGIGLAIVRKAMARVGGRVWAESTPGEGATFFLEFPKPQETNGIG